MAQNTTNISIRGTEATRAALREATRRAGYYQISDFVFDKLAESSPEFKDLVEYYLANPDQIYAQRGAKMPTSKQSA